jgi:hypothetical protein
MQLSDNTHGNYRFLAGIAPYSAGVVAMPGFEIERAVLHTPTPYMQGFQLIDQYLTSLGRPPQALCAVELRLPQPLSFQGFIDFNVGYRDLLAGRDLLLDDVNPIARTNIAPAILPPDEPSLYAFSYTVRVPGGAPDEPPTFVVAGAGDLRDQAVLSPQAVVRPGDSSLPALREKVGCVMAVMQERLLGLGMRWEDVTTVDLYTVHNIQPLLADAILSPTAPGGRPPGGAAAQHGVHWFFSYPPIADLAFEMDLRGIRREHRLGLGTRNRIPQLSPGF